MGSGLELFDSAGELTMDSNSPVSTIVATIDVNGREKGEEEIHVGNNTNLLCFGYPLGTSGQFLDIKINGNKVSWELNYKKILTIEEPHYFDFFNQVFASYYLEKKHLLPSKIICMGY